MSPRRSELNEILVYKRPSSVISYENMTASTEVSTWKSIVPEATRTQSLALAI